MQRDIRVFICYAHEDERLRMKLGTHLALLQQQGLITTWDDRKIIAGAERASEIDTHLDNAQIILLLVSAAFLASRYCYSVEMARALERHEAGQACVIPIIIRPVDWRIAPLSKLQALPTDAKPVTGGGWRNMDEAFVDVVKGLQKAIEKLDMGGLVAALEPSQQIEEAFSINETKKTVSLSSKGRETLVMGQPARLSISSEGEVIMSSSATDMTLALGAESCILRNPRGYPLDPRADKCLQNFVDLFLNSQTMYCTLPRNEDPGMPILIERLNQGHRLQKLPQAAVTLSPLVEHEVFDSFISLVGNPRNTWLIDWVRFQVLNPIVTKGHNYRVSKQGKEMVSPDGYDVWKVQYEQIKKRLSKLLQGPLFVPESELSQELTQYLRLRVGEGKYYSSINEFLLCYAFDVYRRGWQYLAGVRAAGVGAVYFSHELRNTALDAAKEQWKQIHRNQEHLWSWGNYIVKVVKEIQKSKEIPPEQVVEYILALSDTLKTEGYPKWEDAASVFDENNELRKDKQKFLRDLQERVEGIASKAGVPLLRRSENQQAKVDEERMRKVIGIDSKVGSSLILSEGNFFKIVIEEASPETISKQDKVTDQRASDQFLKGTFGYYGLLPELSVHP